LTGPAEVPANQALWDVWSHIHRHSEMYDVERFLAGESSLTEIDRAVVGDVAGKSLLHLQCHMGTDTLSWARLGARVVGVDFSQVAIDHARALADRLAMDAEFQRAEIGALDRVIGDRHFDLIFTSYGVLSWLSNLQPWAREIAHHLAPGGHFHMVEFHPTLGLFDHDGKTVAYPYFHKAEPFVFEETESYAGGSHPPMACYQWSHSLADVFGSLLRAGLKIIEFKEYPFCCHNCYEFLREETPGRYVMKEYPGLIPLLFSITAKAPSKCK